MSKMNESQQLCETMWDLVYGLLTEDESRALIERIKSEPDVARLYAEVRLQADLVARAARVEAPALDLHVNPAVAAAATVERRPAAAAVAQSKSHGARTLFTWLAGSLATSLALLLATGFFWRSADHTTAAATHLVVDVLGPASMQAGLSGSLSIRTYAVSGGTEQLGPADLELSLVRADGEELFRKVLTTQADGTAKVELPGELLEPGVQLAIAPNSVAPSSGRQAAATATPAAKQSLVQTALPVEPEPRLAYMLCAEPTVEAGKAVDVSLWNIAAFSNRLASTDRAQEPMQTVDGLQVQELAVDKTHQGLLRGKLELAQDERADAGVQGPVARPSTSTVPQVASNAVEPMRTAPFAQKTEDSFRPTTVETSGEPQARGGRIVRYAQRNQIAPRDQNGQLNRSVASGQTALRASRTSKQFADSAGTVPQVQRQRAGLGGGQGNFGATAPLDDGLPTIAAGEPIVLSLEADQAGRSLLASAVCRGVTVATTSIDAQPQNESKKVAQQSQTNELRLDVPPEVDGVVDVFVYDRSRGEPELVDQRAVYREPLRRLNIQLTGEKAQFVPGERVQLQLQVTDESGQPTADALVGVRVWNEQVLAQSAEQPLLLEDAVRGGLVEEQLASATPDQELQRRAGDGSRNVFNLQQQNQLRRALAREPVRLEAGEQRATSPIDPEARGLAEREADHSKSSRLAANLPVAPSAPADAAAEGSLAEAPAEPAATTLEWAEPIVLASNRVENATITASDAVRAALPERPWMRVLGWVAIFGGAITLLLLAASAAQRSLPGLTVTAPSALAALASLLIGLAWIGSTAGRSDKLAEVPLPNATQSAGQKPLTDEAESIAASEGIRADESAQGTSFHAAPSDARAAGQPSNGYGTVASRETPTLGGVSAAPPGGPTTTASVSGGTEAMAALPAAAGLPAATTLAVGRANESAAKEDSQEAPLALYFNPQLETDSEGRTQIEFVAPPVKSEYRVLVDALGRGRVGSYQQQLIVSPQVAK